jgi:RsiW-degrading membrane proteinase PrsW (M82 family)
MKRFIFLTVLTFVTFRLFADIPEEKLKIELFDNIQTEPERAADTQKAENKEVADKEAASKVTDVQEATTKVADVPKAANKATDVPKTENQLSTVAYLLYAIAAFAFAFLIWIFIRQRRKIE